MSNHEARVDTWVVGKKCWKAGRAGFVEHAVGAALGHRAKVGKRNCKEVEYVCNGCAMKVSV